MTFEQFQKGENGQGIVKTMKVGPTIADDIKKAFCLGSIRIIISSILIHLNAF